MRKQGHNKVVYEEKLKNAINFALRRDLADPRLTMVSITRVELNQDYSVAKVFWDTFDNGKRGEIKAAIDRIGPKMRSILARELKVRHTPIIELFYDSQFDDERKIEKLLDDESDT